MLHLGKNRIREKGRRAMGIERGGVGKTAKGHLAKKNGLIVETWMENIALFYRLIRGAEKKGGSAQGESGGTMQKRK